MRGSGIAVHARPGIPGLTGGLHLPNVADNLGSCISNIFEAFYLKVAVSK
jgi:hypothetical protein